MIDTLFHLVLLAHDFMSLHKNDEDFSWWKAFGTYGAVGFQWVISLLVGVKLGQWLDEHLHTKPVFMLSGIVLGATAGFYLLLRLLQKK